MRQLRQRGIVTAFVSSLILFGATPSVAAFDFSWEDSATERIVTQGVDVVIVRPISLVRAAAGMVLAIPALLFAAPGGRESIDEVLQVFVIEPVDYVFRRRLGEF